MLISAVLGVYNEEARIEATLRCATWCDEIVVLDKQSTDRTCEIARQYTDKVYKIPYSDFDPDALQRMIDSASHEWILWLTASDILHPGLATQLRELTNRDDFPYDVIHVPYRRYVLGIATKRSPWYSEMQPAVFRKRVVKIRRDDVHGAIDFETNRHYRMPYSTEYCMYHLTHESVDILIEHIRRYGRAEGRLFSKELPLRKAMKAVLRSAYEVLFKRKSYLMGWEGVALGMAFMIYWMSRFVYIWERRRSKAAQTYRRIRETILQKWDDGPGNVKN
jgi:glycosyltransferase involved in cell wall biosynthesis